MMKFSLRRISVLFPALFAACLIWTGTTYAASVNASGGSFTNIGGFDIDDNWTVAYLGNVPDIGFQPTPNAPPTSAAVMAQLGMLTDADYKEAWVLPNDHWPLGQTPVIWHNENPPTSRWITPLNQRDTEAEMADPAHNLSHDPGYYAFKVCFDGIASTMNFTGSIATDNEVIYAYLNGNPIGVSMTPGEQFDFRWLVISGDFANDPDCNELIFVVSNYGNTLNTGNPVGFRTGELVLQFETPDTTPEPATLLLLGTCGASLVGGRMLRQKKNRV